MPVPASINDLSTTASNNSPAGSESPTTTDDYLRTHAAFIAVVRDSANAAYNKTNIVGTVSQSAGVPTGAIIERGSNANGEYVRWADGTQICRKQVGTGSVDSPSGACFLSLTDVGAGAFPAPFVAIPTMGAAAMVSGYSWAVWAANATEATATAWGSYFGVAAAGIAQGVFINIIAVGRWY